MFDPLAITPRNLGAICLPGYCPKCFKRLLHMKFHAPFNHFGAAIFGDAQSCQEAILGYYLAKNGCLPKQFAPFCDCVARTECSKHSEQIPLRPQEWSCALWIAGRGYGSEGWHSVHH